MFAASKTSAVAAGTPPPATDPEFNNVTLLLHGDGTNGAQNNTFVDSSTNNFTITRNGTPTQGSFSPYGDLWSIFSPSSSDLLSGTGNVQFTGNFTIEAWVFITSATTKDVFKIGSEASGRLSFGVDSSNQLFSNAFGASSILYGGASVSLNAWTHVAWVRNGTTVTGYVNGVAQGTQTISGNVGNTSGFSVGQGPMYTSNARFVNGTALYTSNFTPSTTPLTAVSGTSLLTCQSNRFRDNSSNNFAITVNGTPSVQRFSPFDPAAEYSTSVIGGSGYFSGSTQYLTTPTNSAFQLTNTTAFTLEAWVYRSTTALRKAIFSAYNPASAFQGYGLGIGGDSATNQLQFWDGTAWRSFGAIRVNAWTHVAVCSDGTNCRVFVNGVQVGSTFTPGSNINYTAGNIFIGAQPAPQDFWEGYLSNVRLVKGTAVYTSAFTPPTAPLTAITNTSLLLNTVNAGIFDNAMMNNLVTVGNAQVSTAVKKYGTGSMAFDGSGDWLNTAETLPYDMGNGNFTAECWAYPVSTQTSGIVRNANSGSYAGFAIAWESSRFKMLCSYTGTTWAVDVLSSSTYSLNTWHHVAMVRNGSTVTLYVNGTSAATRSVSTNSLLGGQALYVGFSRFSSEFFNGYIDDLRITRVARYTANFTPPTAAFPNN